MGSEERAWVVNNEEVHDDNDGEGSWIDFIICRNLHIGLLLLLLYVLLLLLLLYDDDVFLNMDSEDKKLFKNVLKLYEFLMIYCLLVYTVFMNLSNNFYPLIINRSSELMIPAPVDDILPIVLLNLGYFY